jgi:hypothetical protein
MRLTDSYRDALPQEADELNAAPEVVSKAKRAELERCT